MWVYLSFYKTKGKTTMRTMVMVSVGSKRVAVKNRLRAYIVVPFLQ